MHRLLLDSDFMMPDDWSDVILLSYLVLLPVADQFYYYYYSSSSSSGYYVWM